MRLRLDLTEAEAEALSEALGHFDGWSRQEMAGLLGQDVAAFNRARRKVEEAAGWGEVVPRSRPKPKPKPKGRRRGPHLVRSKVPGR